MQRDLGQRPILEHGNEPMLPPKRREDYVKNLEKALASDTAKKRDIERALSEEPAVTSLKD